ncbi:MAG TPA: aminopeptidase, partial [Candidatus Angelobacter sp.]|nr:aminopeptidase [Candidatus Angelobacter sp.]
MTQQSVSIPLPKGTEPSPHGGIAETPELVDAIASQLVNTCLHVRSEDVVVIETVPHMIPLATRIGIACYKREADTEVSLHTDDGFFGALESRNVEQLSRPSKSALALAEAMTVNVSLVTLENPERLRNIQPEKMAAIQMSRIPIEDIKLNRKVKTAYMGLSDLTAKRAETYGLNLASWRRAVEAASAEDYSELRRFGAKLRPLLKNQADVHIQAPGGTDLKFKLAGRWPSLNDGVIDEEDIQNGAYSIVIPAGDLSVAMSEDSAEGLFISNVRQPYLGRWVEGIEWRFKNGRITEFKAKNNLSALKSEYEASKGQKDRIGVLYLGLNTKAVCGQLFNLNHIASGAISIGIGNNKKLGGVNESEFDFLATVSGG